VIVLPSGRRSTIQSVETADGPLDLAAPPLSVVVRLADDLDVSRGDMLADPDDPPVVAREVVARLCWLGEQPLGPGGRYLVKHSTRTVRAVVSELVSSLDIHTLADVPGAARLELNDLGVIRLRLSEPLCVDPYAECRETGAFILVDEVTGETVGAGMVLEAAS
jgi:sulfate adenylyltransferase subunit 1 (EFTu-like GTPase family)